MVMVSCQHGITVSFYLRLCINLRNLFVGTSSRQHATYSIVFFGDPTGVHQWVPVSSSNLSRSGTV